MHWKISIFLICVGGSNALVNFMLHPQVGWGNTGDLTNQVVKCPTPGAKSAVKFPLCPQVLVGDLTADIWLSIVLLQLKTVASVIPCLCYKNWKKWMSMSNAPGVGTSVNVKSPPEVWGRLGVGVGLEIDRCIMASVWDIWTESIASATYHTIYLFWIRLYSLKAEGL